MELNPAKYKKEVSWSEEDGVFVARVPELPGCATHGDSEAEALSNLNEAIVQHLEALAEAGLEKADGLSKFLLRMPARLKQILVKTANDRDVSINELLIDYINKGLESAGRSTHRDLKVEARHGRVIKKGGHTHVKMSARRTPSKRSAG